jgi:hypothetical protein
MIQPDANFGSREDFKLLADKGISLDGSIALVRYYGTEAGRLACTALRGRSGL